MNNAHIRLRQTLGALGIALPVIVVLFGLLGDNQAQWYYSISATYYTNAGPLFVAIMGAVGLFLITYQGYKSNSINWLNRNLDAIINTASGILALVIAFFPCSATDLSYVGILYLPLSVSSLIHNIAACVFFLLLAVNILFLFTKSISWPTKQKITRNLVYRICGSGILVFIGIQAILTVSPLSGPYTLINEAGMLLCFGIAWLIKGEALLKDKPALPDNWPKGQ
jgi:hypothetical protein